MKYYSPFSLRYILTALLWFVTLTLQAQGSQNHENQKMWVESFSYEEKDPTANLEGTTRIDINGEKSALIKIVTTQKGFVFDPGSLGVTEVEEQNTAHPAEIWLYVPRGVKTLSIQHPVLGAITKYDLGLSLQPARTYRMVLTTNEVSQISTDYDQHKTFTFDIFPPNATLYINGVALDPQKDGKYVRDFPFGSKTYRVAAENYYPEDGVVIIDNDAANNEKKIVLKQAFGYLSIPASEETRGAEVFVDNKIIGTIPMEKIPVKSGKHNILINQRLYKPYSSPFEMTDSAFVILGPKLESNFAEVNFMVSEPDVEIYDNGQKINFTDNKLSTRLEEGRHTIEVKKPSYTTTSKTIEVKTGVRQSVGLESPHPIFGYVTLTTQPAGVNVYLNGKFEGVTPITNKQILIGNYRAKFELKGYKTEERNIIVTQDKPVSENVKLNGYCSAMVNSDPSRATVYINGKSSGSTPYRLDLFTGTYEIQLRKEGYLPFAKKMELNASTPDMNIKLRRNFLKESEFYFQIGYNALGLSGMNFGIGGYIKNINLEANYLLGLSKSEMIYWNDTSYPGYPYGSTYTPWGMDLKAGYGFGFLGRLRITPALGIQMMRLKEDNYGELANGAGAASLTFGAKFEVVLVNHLALSVNPQYMMPISRSDTYKAMADISNKIKGYSSGFGLNFSVNAFF